MRSADQVVRWTWSITEPLQTLPDVPSAEPECAIGDGAATCQTYHGVPMSWPAVDEMRWQYQHTIDRELRANEAHLADKTGGHRAEWQATMRAKSDAWMAYRNAVHEAVESGVPRPCDHEENG